MTKYKVTDPAEDLAEPVANVWLAEDGSGNIDIVINEEIVAFFNQHGELWRVNFPREEIGELQRAGIRFERGGGAEEEFFVIKLG